MARPLYSALLAEVLDAPAGTQTFDVPAGVIWVVRDIDAYNVGGFNHAVAYGIRVYDSNNVMIYASQVPGSRYRKPEQWQGRQVLESGDALSITTEDDGWTVRVSGYVLTAP